MKISTKITTKLFNGLYQYKIVLVCPGVNIFKKDPALELEALKKLSLAGTNRYKFSNLTLTQDDIDFLCKLHNTTQKIQNFDFRIESPWISIYTNDKSSIDKLIKLDEKRVKYVSAPPDNTVLDDSTIIMPKKDFEFRITLGKTNSEHSTFVNWAESNKNLQLTKSCKRALLRNHSWGGTHFYITGKNNLLMAKMHLGGCISKVERIIKA